MKRITGKQLEIMKVLWDSDKSLTASEIADSSENLNINTVQACLRQLLNKEYVQVSDIVYSGTVLCRSYKPVVAKQEYLSVFFQDALGNGIGTALSFINEKADTSMLDELEDAIKLKREKLKV